MKIDIVNAFWTGFVQADERHPKVQSFHQSVWEKTTFPITIQPIDSKEYLEHVLAVLKTSKDQIDQILSWAPNFEQVQQFKDYYSNGNNENMIGLTQEYEKLDKQIDDMVDALIEKYSQNILINQASDPISLVRKIKSKFFLVVTGSFCANNGHGEFTLKEFLINDIKKTVADEAMNISVETLNLSLWRIIRGQWIGKYEAMIRAYENGYQPSMGK